MAQVGFWLALLAGTWLALTPKPPEITPMVSSDKVRHALAFCLLLLLARKAWPKASLWLRLFLPLLSYGLLIEIMQHQLPPRSFEWLDLAADGVGLLCAALVPAWVFHSPSGPTERTS
jgi:VanZ family protein